MNRKIALLTVLLLLSTYGYCQQNLFNIPSGDITLNKKIFYQHQLNVYSDQLESKAHFVYGLGKGWDAGVNLVGKGVYFSPVWRIQHNDDPAKGALYPILMGTLQKQFSISEQLKVNLGGQVGWNLSNKVSNKEVNFFTYGLAAYYFKDGKSRIVGGVYQTNQEFVGQGNTYGAVLGYEISLSKRWYLMGDWISGDNDSSAGVFGGMYNLTKRIQLCGGVLVPNPNTPKPFGFVLEINLLTWDAF